MKTPTMITLVACWLAFGLNAAEQPSLNTHLEPLRPLLGKTLQGTFKNSTPENPVVDVSRWERILNGQGVRMLHSINDGAYGGETIFMWDQERKAIVYFYFTTAGFRTTGTLEVKEGKFVTHETVSGAGGGATEVRGTSVIRPDGRFHVKTEYLKDGNWTPGRETTYEEAPSASVVFR